MQNSGNRSGKGDVIQAQNKEPKINPNSEFDDNIVFDSSSSNGDNGAAPRLNFGMVGQIASSLGTSNLQPGEYSPRPSAQEVEQVNQFSLGNTGGNLQNYEVDFNPSGELTPMATPMSRQGGLERNFNNTGASNFTGLGNGNLLSTNGSGFSDFSPRPGGQKDLSNSPVLNDLFNILTKFQPPPLDLAPHFKPFLPELIPSVGQIDAFIKIPRPDGAQDPLGLTVLDEPTIGQSNPQILRMQLRENYDVVTPETDGLIGTIQDAAHNEKALNSFIEAYDDISTRKAPPSMTYTTTMPDTEKLMEEFPPELITVLQSAPFPPADVDMTVEEYAATICSMLDIPVRGNIIESLHMVFTLFEEFRHNVYFQEKGSNSQSRGSTPSKM